MNSQLVNNSNKHLSKENQTIVKKSSNNDQKVNFKQNKQLNKKEDVQKDAVNLWLHKQADQENKSKLCNNSSLSNGIKRKLNGRPIRKIKKPKFLDDSSSSSSSEEEILNEHFNQLVECVNDKDESAHLIWKKKRAALELQAKETFQKESNEHSTSVNQEEQLNYSLDEVILNKSNSSLDEECSFQEEDEIYDDRFAAALALIGLSKSRPIIEYSSEMDLSEANEYNVHSEFSVNEVHVEHCSDYFASSQGDFSGYHEEYY